MQILDKILQLIRIPHLALLSIIFAMMLLSFPFGVFVVFDTNIGNDVNFQYPLSNLELFKELGFAIPFHVEVGDLFIVLWSIYAVLFAIALFGPNNGFLKTLSSNLSNSKSDTKSNYMFVITKWFSILILVSIIIDSVQQGFGIVTVPPHVDNDLTQFLYVSLSPIVEEFGFRVILIGLPLFVFYSHKLSFSHFLKSLWSPNRNLHIYDSKKPLLLIVLVGVFFGISHIITGEPWSEGKLLQASVSGIILGWLYFRFGLIAAILVHWATNYFIFSYANFISQINQITIEEAFLQPMINTMELLFFISGIFSISVLLVSYFNSKKERKLKIE
ncbi:CAAX amino terminal protease family protein [Candidatus Nitrosarchaeum limnium BG20]|uniref:CAAX amino terminal protease family protein n=2 Tax=Nitrosarchaeum TaxID=1007082 RepID=S2E4Q2_9ARCH|nr:CAAX amino terminal protease family protein [Candidatus Nitrosarchaeum limnium BG20]